MKTYYASAYATKKGYKEFKSEINCEGRVLNRGLWFKFGEGVFEEIIDAIEYSEMEKLQKIDMLRKSILKLQELNYGASK